MPAGAEEAQAPTKRAAVQPVHELLDAAAMSAFGKTTADFLSRNNFDYY